MYATALVRCRQPQWHSAWLSSSGNSSSSCSTHAKHSNLQLMCAACGLAVQAVAGTQQVMGMKALIMLMHADLKQQQPQPSCVWPTVDRERTDLQKLTLAVGEDNNSKQFSEAVASCQHSNCSQHQPCMFCA
jgi:hypothetical protein